MSSQNALLRRDRPVLTVLIAVLLGTAVCFRVMYLSRVPGINGDEGWWGNQALAWLANQPYEARTTSGNFIDLFFLVPVAVLHAFAPPSFLLLRTIPALVNLLALPVGYWFINRAYGSTTAWIYTVALACMPTAIAHSRIATSGGRSHLTYVTAGTEPKQQALERILGQATGRAGVVVLIQQWSLYWPVRYLATEHPNVSVGMGLNRAPRQDLEEAIQNGRLFLVEFAETPELAAALDWVHQRGLNVASTPVQSAGGRDLLLVLRVSAAR